MAERRRVKAVGPCVAGRSFLEASAAVVLRDVCHWQGIAGEAGTTSWQSGTEAGLFVGMKCASH